MFSNSCWDWEGAKINTSLFFSWILNKLTNKTISDQNISFTGVRLKKRVFPLLSKDFFLISVPPPPDPPSHGQSWATTVPEKAGPNDQILWSPMTRSREPVISQIMHDPDALSSPPPQTPIREVSLFPCSDWSEGEEIPFFWAKLRMLWVSIGGKMISLQLIPESQANVHELRLPGLGRRVNANFVFNGDRVSILQGEKSSVEGWW